jgi:hypothetical protein
MNLDFPLKAEVRVDGVCGFQRYTGPKLSTLTSLITVDVTHTINTTHNNNIYIAVLRRTLTLTARVRARG